MRLHLRLDDAEAGVDAAAPAEFRYGLASQTTVPFAEPPVEASVGTAVDAPVDAPVGAGPAAGRMGALQTVIEVVVGATQVAQLVLAVAQWRKANRKPPVVVSVAGGDTSMRIESTDPHAVAEIVRALGGS